VNHSVRWSGFSLVLLCVVDNTRIIIQTGDGGVHVNSCVHNGKITKLCTTHNNHHPVFSGNVEDIRSQEPGLVFHVYLQHRALKLVDEYYSSLLESSEKDIN